jgi:hypothetical protein
MTPRKASPEVAPSESAIEDAIANLLAGPFDKVSITLPSALRNKVASRADERGLSAYVAEVLAREERRLALIDFLDYMDEKYGPPTDEELARADERWEEMWERHEAGNRSEASSSMPQH